MRRPSLLLVLVFFLCSCDRDADLTEMMADPTVRLSVQGVTQFTYDSHNCQLGFCREKAEFRIHTDNMSDYFTVKLDRIPTTVGEQVIGDVTWTAASTMEHKKDVTFNVLKLEGDAIWLRNEADRISAVIRILE